MAETRIMFLAHAAVTVVELRFTGAVLVTYLIGHDHPKDQLRMKRPVRC
ncbi:hypothetical protein [Streptomyces sp. NPDC057460]